MKVLGIHDGHNASVALLEDGKLKFAIQEERLNRIKNYDGFPFLSVKHTLDRCGLSQHDIDAVAIGSLHLPFPRTKEELLKFFENSSSIFSKGKELLKKTPIKNFHRKERREDRIKAVEKAGLKKEKTGFVEHHLCHAFAAYWGSPFRSEKVLVMTCDGAGDDLCATVSIAHEDGKIERIASVSEGDSLGMLYAITTFAMGMVPNEHEYKLMGMAPYAPQDGLEKSYRRFKETFRFEENGLTWKRNSNVPHAFNAYSYVKNIMDLHRFDWVCAGIQKLTEDILVTWVKNALRETGIKKVVLAGGVFMNVKANKAIMELPEVESLFVFPSCGDETNAIGAAYHAYYEYKKNRGEPIDIEPLGPFYLGGDFTNNKVERILKDYKFTHRIKIREYSDIEKEIAGLLNRGEVVARLKGRMEFGARSLGNRSILANPSDWKVVKTINEMIKMRDFWMPFAPSIKGDKTDKYIVNPKGIKAPYMILTFDTVKDRIGRLMATIHPYDETCRPQEVYSNWNSDYYNLLTYYEEMTGEAAILNTSFNLHGFPIVYTPEDALEVFEKAGLKYIALENFLIEKRI